MRSHYRRCAPARPRVRGAVSEALGTLDGNGAEHGRDGRGSSSMHDQRERDGEYEPTRAYDRGEWTSFDEPTQRFEPAREPAAGGATAGDGGAPQQRTDEIEVARPVRSDAAPRYDEAPRYQEAPRYEEAPRAAPVDRDLRPGWSGQPAADALARLEHESPGPRPWARVLSLVLSVLAIAPIIWLVWDLRLVNYFQSVAVQALGTVFDRLDLMAPVLIAMVAALLLVIGLCAGLSGLGPAVAGALAIVGGIVIWFAADRAYALSAAMGLGGPGALVLIGVLLVGVGIGAHFARRGGYRRALRIVRATHRM